MLAMVVSYSKEIYMKIIIYIYMMIIILAIIGMTRSAQIYMHSQKLPWQQQQKILSVFSKKILMTERLAHISYLICPHGTNCCCNMVLEGILAWCSILIWFFKVWLVPLVRMWSLKVYGFKLLSSCRPWIFTRINLLNWCCLGRLDWHILSCL